MDVCIQCGAPVSPLGIALTKKLINRASTTSYCVDCLSLHFNVSKRFLLEKAKDFKRQGCALFDEISL